MGTRVWWSIPPGDAPVDGRRGRGATRVRGLPRPEAALMAVASLAGGWVGAFVARRLPSGVMRTVVTIYGVGVALVMLWRG